MSEYGIPSPQQLAETWTPGQIMVMVDEIQRRHALRGADQMEMEYLAVGGAMGGKKGLAAVRKAARRMRRMGGLVQRVDAHDLAQRLGLTVRT
jgi:hypothetical protein